MANSIHSRWIGIETCRQSRVPWHTTFTIFPILWPWASPHQTGTTKISEKIVPLTHLHTVVSERAECPENSGLLHKDRLSPGEGNGQKNTGKCVKECKQNYLGFPPASFFTDSALPRSLPALTYSLHPSGLSCGYPACRSCGVPTLPVKQILGEIILPKSWLCLIMSLPQ